MKKSYGYDSYRGRNVVHTLIKGLALGLTLIVVVGGVLSIFLGRNILVSKDGIRFDFSHRQEKPPEPMPSDPVVLVTPSPSPTPEVVEEPHLQVLPLDASALADGTAPDLVADWESNAVILDMKPDSGILGFVSQCDSAKWLGSNPQSDTLNATIQAVLDTPDLHTVARVSAFRDDRAPYQNNAMALRATYGNWRDESGSRWLNPGNLAAQQYIMDLCLELAAMGFDEILLDNACFPTQGNLKAISLGANYNPDTLDQTMGDFYSELRQTLSDYPKVQVSIVTHVATLTQEEIPNGQQVEDLTAFHRIWCSEMGDHAVTCQKVLTDLGMEDVTRNLVDIRVTPGDESHTWALLPK